MSNILNKGLDLKRVLLFLGLTLTSSLLAAQVSTASLSGKVTDQTGAVIPQASVSVTGADGKHVATTATGQEGAFHVGPLPDGAYNLTVTAEGFAPLTQSNVTVQGGRARPLTLVLHVQAQEEKVQVESERGSELDVSSSSNAGALIIKGKDLEALSDDPDDLESELQALAGPSAGPNGGQIYIDGFTGGQLPPKSSIREIRINQNPFSAQYDKLGYGRIEIFTKPGTDKFHGQFFFNNNNSIFNSRNPYVLTKPSYNSEIFNGNFGGPLNKKASFFLDFQKRNIHEFSAINAIVLDSNLNQVPFIESVPNPRTRTSFSPRFDFQLTPNNTLTVRYRLTHDADENAGLNQFSLPSQAYSDNETEHTFQISDSQVLSTNVVNETRFEFERDIEHQLPVSALPTVQVQGAFTSGGNAEGTIRSTQNNYELQNYTSVVHGNHLIKFGGRLRGLTQSDFRQSNFNGTFVFSPDFSNGQSIEAIEVYKQMLQCQQSGGSNCSTASQFSMVAGNPQVDVTWFDAGLYAEDEWRVRPNLSLTYGLRFESQNNIHDHADFAPRLGFAWGLGGGSGRGAPKTVLRAGFGVFYDRFGYNLVEQAERLNGITQLSAVVRDPDFYDTIPPFDQLPSAVPTIYRISSDLRAPYTMQTAVSVERQITKAATVSVTYLNSRGEHALFIRNAGDLTQNPPSSNIYEYDSSGIFRQNQLIANARISAGRMLSLFGFYTLNYANSNVASGGGGGFFGNSLRSSANFLSDSLDPMADYGRAAFDVRHRVFVGGYMSLPYAFSISPFVIISSGLPYNVTTGQDNNGDSIFNDRPWLGSTANFVCTSRSSFSLTATSTGQVPINDCTGPGNATLNMRLSKTIGLGREEKGGGGGPMHGPHGPRGGLGGRGLSGGGGNFFHMGESSNRRYTLTFSIMAHNLLNTWNPGPPVGNLSSPNFGQSISIIGGPFSSASANRRIDMQVRFSF